MSMDLTLVVHGHFYQPPRENPWTKEVEPEPGAAPHHDWNERIFRECYRPNAYARVINDSGRVEQIVNNYEHISFNFGPTLLSWMAKQHPISYARILEADRRSARARGGHGNALAQAFNHAILPLCNSRDRKTQVVWGIADFKHRFQRSPEGLWLAEAAANLATLDALIEQGLRFTILSPYQAARIRRLDDPNAHWQDVHGQLDPSVPYRYFHSDGSGRSLDIIFYDGPRSRAIAFEGALSSSQDFLNNLIDKPNGQGPLVSVSTDGESYGHHTRWGDRCIAHALAILARQRGLKVSNYAEHLDHHPPRFEVQLHLGEDGQGSSWSCAHGVGRWHRDCGCQTGGEASWNQAWRTPLRDALDHLRDFTIERFEDEGGQYFKDPWDARDAYIEAILDPDNKARFLAQHQRRGLSSNEQVRALSLLEMQHHAMLMYTSCGWFFSDISGIETLQILKYAARVLDHLEELGHPAPLASFLERLGEAKSNIPERGTGADLFRSEVEPRRVFPRQIAAHIAISHLAQTHEETGEEAGYTFVRERFSTQRQGQLTLCTGVVRLEEIATGAKHESALAAMHLGGIDFHCVACVNEDQAFESAASMLHERFRTDSLPALLRLASELFGPEEYGLEHLLPGAQERISGNIFAEMVDHFCSEYSRLYQSHRRTLDRLHSSGFKLPNELKAAAEFTLGRRFEEEIEKQGQSRDPQMYKRAVLLAEDVAQRGYQIDRSRSSILFERIIVDAVRVATARAEVERFDSALALLQLSERLGLQVDLELAQEALCEAIPRLPQGLEARVLLMLDALGMDPDIWRQQRCE